MRQINIHEAKTHLSELVEDVARGEVLVRAGTIEETHLADAIVEVLPDARPLKHGARVRFHQGTAEVLGRVAVVGPAANGGQVGHALGLRPAANRATAPSANAAMVAAFASRTPFSASSTKSDFRNTGSRITEPAITRMPPGRYSAKQRCAAMASAFTPSASRGRPGTCTSEALMAVVVPPWT